MRARVARVRYRKMSASSRSKFLLFMIMTTLYCPLVRIRLHGESRNEPDDIRRISRLAQELCARLQMAAKIDPIIMDENKYGVSVEPVSGTDGEYALSFDRKLFESLTNDELTAAVAHEIGHIWIYNHHPYLQTEPLANEVALRLVSRETMKAVYSKLWLRLGISGNLEDVLGPDMAAAAAQNTAVNHH